MTNNEIISHRLLNQQLEETKFTRPNELVSWLGAIQAQDFTMAKWAIGLRLPGATSSSVEKAFNDGTILRTHLMRPTWHFVCPSDIRWLLALTEARVNIANAYMYRQMDLDEKIFNRCNEVLTKNLEGKKYLDRTEIKSALAQENIIADGVRLVCLLMHAELDGILCSGPRIGKQFTYALLEERVPAAPALTKEEALAELSCRYFSSRGPATANDFAWWSGLSMKEVKEGIALLPSSFIRRHSEGREYIMTPCSTEKTVMKHTTFLLPDYDEYAVSYKDRTAILDKDISIGERGDENFLFSHVVIVDGKIRGTWKVNRKNKKTEVTTNFIQLLNQPSEKALAEAIKKYETFFGH